MAGDVGDAPIGDGGGHDHRVGVLALAVQRVAHGKGGVHANRFDSDRVGQRGGRGDQHGARSPVPRRLCYR